MPRSKSLDKYPEGRLFVLDCGDSDNFEERLHEQIMAGGGYYADKKLVDVESLPAGEDFSPELALIAKEELKAEEWHSFRNLSCSSEPKESQEFEREFRAPFSEGERREFIRSIPFIPVR